MFKEGYGFDMSVIGQCGECGGKPEITTHCTGDVVVACKGCGLKRIYTSFQHALIGWNSIGRRPEWEFEYLKDWEYRCDVFAGVDTTHTWTNGGVCIELSTNMCTGISTAQVRVSSVFDSGTVIDIDIEDIHGEDFSYAKFDAFIRGLLSAIKPLIDIHEYISSEECTL